MRDAPPPLDGLNRLGDPHPQGLTEGRYIYICGSCWNGNHGNCEHYNCECCWAHK